MSGTKTEPDDAKRMRAAEAAFLRRGPELGELVAETRDGRKGGRKRIAVAIPTRNWNEILSEHVKRLSKQAFRDFDVIIVYGEDDEFLDDVCGLPVVHIRRKADCGSAGGFYIGEKFAFDEGYDMVVLADNDALPDSDSLVGEAGRRSGLGRGRRASESQEQARAGRAGR